MAMLVVLYCTLLAQAQSATERSQIESEMIADPELTEYLKQLQGGDEEGMDTTSTPASRQAAREAAESMDTGESTKVNVVIIDFVNFGNKKTFDLLVKY